jgi:hypothetical protein
MTLPCGGKNQALRIVLIESGIPQIRTSIQVFSCPRFEKSAGTPESANKKSTIARDSICRAALCPSQTFRMFGAIHLFFCVDHELLQN